MAGILDQLMDAVCVVDEHGQFLFLSAACEEILGYKQHELVGKPMIELVHPADRQRTLKAAGEIMAGQPKRHFENRYIRKDGRIIDIMWSARWLEKERVRVAVARDVTRIKQAERVREAVYRITETAYGAQDLQSIYQGIHQMLSNLLDCCGLTLLLSDPITLQTETVYQSDDCPIPLADAEDMLALHKVVTTGELIRRNTQQTANTVHCDWLGLPLRAQGQVIGAMSVQRCQGWLAQDEQQLLQFVCTQIAATIARKQAEEKLLYLASHDILTNLPNRMLFMDRFDMALKLGARNQSRVGLLFVDLDKFKQVNDAYGHDVGDMLLVETSRRLECAVRNTDTVARIGGDEFTLLLNFINDSRDAELVVEKILEAMEAPFVLADIQLQISASIGLAIYPDHGQDKETLLRVADSLMYQVKKNSTSPLL
nr:diguanylate cyclase [Bowmanella yangjiangensis]